MNTQFETRRLVEPQVGVNAGRRTLLKYDRVNLISMEKLQSFLDKHLVGARLTSSKQ